MKKKPLTDKEYQRWLSKDPSKWTDREYWRWEILKHLKTLEDMKDKFEPGATLQDKLKAFPIGTLEGWPDWLKWFKELAKACRRFGEFAVKESEKEQKLKWEDIAQWVAKSLMELVRDGKYEDDRLVKDKIEYLRLAKMVGAEDYIQEAIRIAEAKVQSATLPVTAEVQQKSDFAKEVKTECDRIRTYKVLGKIAEDKYPKKGNATYKKRKYLDYLDSIGLPINGKRGKTTFYADNKVIVDAKLAET